MSIPRLIFKNIEYLLINGDDSRDEGAIATPKQFESFALNDYHLNRDGTITRFGEVVGHKEDITWIENA